MFWINQYRSTSFVMKDGELGDWTPVENISSVDV